MFPLRCCTCASHSRVEACCIAACRACSLAPLLKTRVRIRFPPSLSITPRCKACRCSRDCAECKRVSLIRRMYVLQVTPEGKYVPPPASNQKASYATMVYVRATIVEGAGWALARSVTIAVSSFHTCCTSMVYIECCLALPSIRKSLRPCNFRNSLCSHQVAAHPWPGWRGRCTSRLYHHMPFNKPRMHLSFDA